MDQNFLEGLNKPQYDAVTCLEGPMLVIAGAGSGKTRVLTLRIANLISNGVKPYNILALTFTNKAAKEMKERIARIVGEDLAHQIWMGTFHSVFAKILRIEAPRLGLSSDFTIYDTTDSRSLLKRITKEMGLDDKTYKTNAVAATISQAKNDLIWPEAYANNADYQARDKSAQRPQMPAIYKRYLEECRKSNALDFDDLLLYTNVLFANDADALAKYQSRFQHILVDEYQDTNLSQYVVINRLAQANRNICVVGDDAQSIYSFRGAKIENILNFQKDYSEAKTFKLEQNYRSTQNIVGAANMLIHNNINQLHKDVFSEGEEGDKVRVTECQSDIDEAGKVVRDIATRSLYEHKRPHDFAVLYRTNAQSRVIEEELRRAGIPYIVYGGLAFYQRKEIKDCLSYLRLVVNPTDTESLIRAIGYPKRQIGETSLEKASKVASSANVSLWDVLSDSRLLATTGINNPTQKRILAFVDLIKTFSIQAEQLDAFTLAKEVLQQSGVLNELSLDKNDSEGKDRFENVQELLNGLNDYVQNQAEAGESNDLRSYLQDVALITDMDRNVNDDAVTLMTIHTSKGLEFDTIYIVGVEEEIFPGQQSALNPQSLEEERRLLYVAITRGRFNVNISYAKSRFKYNRSEPSRPSRFIKELDEKYCDKPKEKLGFDMASSFGMPRSGNSRGDFSRSSGHFGFRQPANTNGNGFGGFSRPTKPLSASSFRKEEHEAEPTITETPDKKYRVGMHIMHDRFGRGTILSITGQNMNDVKLRIAFDTQGEKTLLIKFARITPCD